MPDYHVECSEVTDLAVLEKRWLELQRHTNYSFFQSWAWVGNWLRKVAMNLSPQVLTVSCNSQLFALGIFIPHRLRRHHVFFSQAFFLNEAPFAGNNMVIEYNGLLVMPGHEVGIYKAMLSYLLRHYPAVDEFYFGAMTSMNAVYNAAQCCRGEIRFICQQHSDTFSVRLDVIGESLDDYLATLGKNRRLQIRRSIRLYEERGELQIEAANTTEQAQIFLDNLKALHTTRWQKSGQSGSFANARWEAFHRVIIATRFDRGDVQLLRVFNDDGDIGYLYNFICGNTVYVLQSGFSQETDKRLLPGYITHVMAIVYNGRQGKKVYDFMHGDSLYKKLLCNQQQRLYWMTLQRHRGRFVLEDLVRQVVRKIKGQGI